MWRGKLSHAMRHTCPYEPCAEHTIEELEEILEEDERCNAKYQCIVELCRRGRVAQKSEEKLDIMGKVFGYMKKYAWAMPIQREGVGLMVEIVEQDGSLNKLACACPGVMCHLRTLAAVPSLEERVKLLLGKQCVQKDDDGAKILIALQSGMNNSK